MIQKTVKYFIDEIYSKPPQKNYSTNKTDVYHIYDIWTLDILDLEEIGLENNRIYRYILVVIDHFSKFGWTKPIKKMLKQNTNSFGIFLISSKRKPKLVENDRGKEFHNIFFKVS